MFPLISNIVVTTDFPPPIPDFFRTVYRHSFPCLYWAVINIRPSPIKGSGFPVYDFYMFSIFTVYNFNNLPPFIFGQKVRILTHNFLNVPHPVVHDYQKSVAALTLFCVSLKRIEYTEEKYLKIVLNSQEYSRPDKTTVVHNFAT